MHRCCAGTTGPLMHRDLDSVMRTDVRVQWCAGTYRKSKTNAAIAAAAAITAVCCAAAAAAAAIINIGRKEKDTTEFKSSACTCTWKNLHFVFARFCFARSAGGPPKIWKTCGAPEPRSAAVYDKAYTQRGKEKGNRKNNETRWRLYRPTCSSVSKTICTDSKASVSFVLFGKRLIEHIHFV